MISSVKNSKEIMKKKKLKWMFSVFLVSIFVGFFSMSLSMGGVFLLKSNFSDAGFEYFGKFFSTTFTEPVLLFERYIDWAEKSFALISSGKATIFSFFVFIPIALFIITFVIGYLICPYNHESSLLDNNIFVSLKELKRAGFLKGIYSIIGKYDNYFIRLPEQFSTLIYGNAKTLKTNSCSIPAIFSNDTNSIAVIDNEGEIFKKTSGYRSKIGKVYYFDWDRLDKPEMGIYYPRWNPLSEKCLPDTSSMRDQYFAALSHILIPDVIKEDEDPYWTKKARDVFDVFMEFIICKAIQANANDYYLSFLSLGKKIPKDEVKILKGYYSSMPVKEARKLLKLIDNNELNYDNYLPIGSWETIPEIWHGYEASLPMLYDWLYSLKDIDTETVLKNAIEEIEFFNYSKTLLAEFNKLLTYSVEQRKNILEIILEYLKIFKIASVREKTMECDFHYYDLRGEFDENNNKFSPISLYLTFDDNSPTNILSHALIEMSVLSMMSYDNKDNKELFPVSFIFDDFDELPRFNEAIKGPSFGKSQRASFMFLINDIENMKAKYSIDEINLINQTTSIKIAKDDVSALYFSQYLNNDILVKQFSNLGDKEKLKKEYQMIFIDRFGKRPVIANAPTYFSEKTMMILSEIEYSAFVNSADLEQRSYDKAPSFDPDNLVYTLTDFDDAEEDDDEIASDVEDSVEEFEGEEKENKIEAIEEFKSKVIREAEVDLEEDFDDEQDASDENQKEKQEIAISEMLDEVEEEIFDEIEKIDITEELSDLVTDDEFNDNELLVESEEIKFEPVAREEFIQEGLFEDKLDEVNEIQEDLFGDLKNDNEVDIESNINIENLSIIEDAMENISSLNVKEREELIIDDPVAIDKELDDISAVFSTTKSETEKKVNVDNLSSLRRLNKSVSNLDVKPIKEKVIDEDISNEENLKKIKSELKENEDAWWMEEDVFSVENNILENPFSKKEVNLKAEDSEDYLNKSISNNRNNIDKKISLDKIDFDD